MSYVNHYGRRRHPIGRYLLLLVVLVLVAGAIVFVGVKQIKQHPDWTKPVAEYYGRAAGWIAERKLKFKQTAALVRKNVEVGDDPERVVNFEFYNTLTDMQSMQSQAEAEVATKPDAKNIEKKTVKTLATTNTTTSPKLKNKKTIISQADDLEKDMLATMKQSGGK